MKQSILIGKRHLLFIAFLASTALTSCLKHNKHFRFFNDKDEFFHPGKPIVLVAGFETKTVQNGIAKFWINGDEVPLSDGTNSATANSIFASSNAIYTCGSDGGPVYWQNNKEKKLPTTSEFASANSIAESCGNVYVAGIDGNSAVYWKNGSEVFLDVTDAYGSYPDAGAYSIFITGNDIYIAGFHGPNAVYWKNGVEVYLTTNGLIGFGSYVANSISVSGGNVYAVGNAFIEGATANIGYYWVNGTNEIASLDHGNSDGIEMNSIFTLGSNVYIAGNGVKLGIPNTYTGAYWVNASLNTLSSNSSNSAPSGIFATVKDVYVSGHDGNSAVYWKNGSEIILSDVANNAAANSIYVK